MKVETDEIVNVVREVTEETEFLIPRAQQIESVLRARGINALHDTHSRVKPDEHGTIQQERSVWIDIHDENACEIAEAVVEGCDGTMRDVQGVEFESVLLE